MLVLKSLHLHSNTLGVWLLLSTYTTHEKFYYDHTLVISKKEQQITLAKVKPIFSTTA